MFTILNGQTDRFSVWANGNQNSRLVNFVPELPVYHLYKPVQFTEKRPRKPETGMQHSDADGRNSFAPENFPFRKFFTGTTRKSCSTCFPTGFSGNFLKNMANNFSSLTFTANVKLNPGADPGFYLGGSALVSCSTSTPINHIVFFCRIPVVLENRRSSQGGRGVRTPCTLPLDPPLRRRRRFVNSLMC